DVGGSNPLAPTKTSKRPVIRAFFYGQKPVDAAQGATREWNIDPALLPSAVTQGGLHGRTTHSVL
ncbi:MAG: hypothetical protein ACYCSH_13870, partial [Acidithiobacillus sp.]